MMAQFTPAFGSLCPIATIGGGGGLASLFVQANIERYFCMVLFVAKSPMHHTYF